MALIGLISDVHATPAPIEEAILIFRREGVDEIWCAGDIAGYSHQLGETIKLLQECNCKSIRGNHELSYLQKHNDERGSW